MSASAVAFLLSIAAGLAFFIAAIAHEARVVAEPASLAVAEKQPTDSATRAGMEKIRIRVIDAHTLITHRRMPVHAARRFASTIQSETERISRLWSETKPRSDELELLLQKIANGGQLVAGQVDGRDPIDGLIDIVDALEAYARAFDHPGWKPLQSQ